jgi:pilus assembly protein CpaB
MLAAALVAAILAGYLAYGVLEQFGDTAEARTVEFNVVDVAVAARDMGAGRVLEARDVRLIEWPAGSVPSGFSRSPAEVVGRGLLTDVKENEPLLAGKMASKEAGGGLPVVIPAGKRAMSVEVDEVVGVAGFVLPGTRVDVLVTLDQSAGEQIPRARILLQNILVASAGQITERDAQGEPKSVTVVTLLVDPAEGEKLALASAKGSLRLALRNSLDTETVATPGVIASRLIADAPAPRPARRSPTPRAAPEPEPPARPTRFEIEVYRGPERSTSTVEERQEQEEGQEEGQEGEQEEEQQGQSEGGTREES